MKKSLLLIVALLASLSAWAQNAPALGDLFYSDGTFSSTLVEGKTPIGVVAYLGSDSFSENGVTLRDGVTTLNSYGLVLCLKNAATNVIWGPDNLSLFEFGIEKAVSDLNDLKRSTDVSGYTNTKTLVEKNASNYVAASAAWNYAGLEAPANTTGWFLPSAQQWVRMIVALGGITIDDIGARQAYFSPSAATNWDNALSKAGEGNYESIKTSTANMYWTSSEFRFDAYGDGYAATVFYVNNNGFRWTGHGKTSSVAASYCIVRPVLAFSYEEDTPTGIVNLDAAQPKSGQRYNLMGQPVGKDYKGIVIEDGRKLIVR